MSNWQLPNAPDVENFPFVVAAMQKERLMRYLPAAGGDEVLALRYYLWNCALCEGFHLSMHYAEIVSRNTINRALVARLGQNWFYDSLFRGLLDARYRADLDDGVSKEKKAHGDRMTEHHVVSSLTFGFWNQLTTKRFERLLWINGVRSVFPNASDAMRLEDINTKITGVRHWRNRMAHHSALFDKGPMQKHAEALDLISMSCSRTSKWVARTSRIPAIIAARPR